MKCKAAKCLLYLVPKAWSMHSEAVSSFSPSQVLHFLNKSEASMLYHWWQNRMECPQDPTRIIARDQRESGRGRVGVSWAEWCELLYTSHRLRNHRYIHVIYIYIRILYIIHIYLNIMYYICIYIIYVCIFALRCRYAVQWVLWVSRVSRQLSRFDTLAALKKSPVSKRTLQRNLPIIWTWPAEPYLLWWGFAARIEMNDLEFENADWPLGHIEANMRAGPNWGKTCRESKQVCSSMLCRWMSPSCKLSLCRF